MKKWRILLATAAATVLLSMSAWAATAQISFSDPSVTLGTDVNVTMKVKSGDGTLSRADITLNYDSTALEFLSGTDAEGGAGSVRVHGASNGAGTGTLEYNLKFKTLSAGQGTIRIGTQEVYDTDESIVEITHNGSSTVSIQAASNASKDASLKELTVSPGELKPGFSAENTSYELTVGTDVDNLAINAIPNDGGATVSVSGNETLNIGENAVSITVTAADGSTQTVYKLTVRKQEGGASQESGQTETINEGVKLSSKEKTITIMNPGSGVAVPEGFAESVIDIDGHQVRGWVWKADKQHEYCIVYGMNDAGELDFYRYDLTDKTLQRYFSDPIEEALKQNAENYPVLEEKYNQLVKRCNMQLILLSVLGLAVLALIAVIATMLRNSRRGGRADGRTLREDSEALRMASTTRPAAKRAAVSVEDLEETRMLSELPGKAAPPETEEEELGATRPLSDLRKLGEDTEEDAEDLSLTKVLPKSGAASDIEIEEL